MEQEIYSGRMMFYSVSQSNVEWAEMEVEIAEDVEKELLEEVVNDALRLRYPYFAKKLIVVDERFCLAKNTKRLQIYGLDEPAHRLCGRRDCLRISAMCLRTLAGLRFPYIQKSHRNAWFRWLFQYAPDALQRFCLFDACILPRWDRQKWDKTAISHRGKAL